MHAGKASGLEKSKSVQHEAISTNDGQDDDDDVYAVSRWRLVSIPGNHLVRLFVLTPDYVRVGAINFYMQN